MATNKNSRTTAPKKLDDYVASIKKLFGEPESVPDTIFSREKYIATYQDTIDAAIQPYKAYSDYKPIGFEFEINNKKYKEFAVYSGGWMVLKDPGGGTIGSTFWHDVLDTTYGPAAIHVNAIIKSSFSYDHVLLVPWFDVGIPTAKTIDELQITYYNTTISASLGQDILQGKDSREWPYDTIDHATRYINGFDSSRGRYLFVRWTTSQLGYNNRIKFEVALYENGTIEYRYWPIKTFEPGDGPVASSQAAMGIFWSGPAAGSNKFRDLAPLFDYNKELRDISEFGGAPYSSGYTEISSYLPASPSSPYSINIPFSHWPKNGAIITLTPPARTGKFLPRKISSLVGSTRELVSNGGLFDDRKTINFSSQGNVQIHMPSTLPSRLLGDSSDDINISSRQSLFTSGSLSIFGSPKATVIDSHLETLGVLDRIKAPFNNSFNESNKNYQETAVTSSFYTTGSALEIFGDGFTAPLKSKTQFHFSLPVTKQVTMPALLASFYYYDKEKKSWLLIDPNGYRDPERIYSEFWSLVAGDTYADKYGTDFSPIYRVIETSRGFDAVGRKISSGTNINNYTHHTSGNLSETFQTDNAIGAVYNSLSTNFPFSFFNESRSATTRDYRNSITDNSDFFPKKSQMFDIQIDQPFLIEKIVVEVPLYISGAWFDDLTTCTRPFASANYAGANNDQAAFGRFFGPIDFGGPGLTFGLMCARKGESSSYVDLIASGTITHAGDAISSVILKKDPGMHFHCMRPVGFYSFSNPTCILPRENNVFNATAKLEMEASISGGLIFAKNDRSYVTASAINTDQINYQISNRNKAIELLTNGTLETAGENSINQYDLLSNSNLVNYQNRSSRIYLQQISPLSRGSAKINFNGNSILGGNIASFNFKNVVVNPLYTGYATAATLPTLYGDQINSASFGFDATSIYSTVDSKSTPYLVLPGDKLTISMSKTRPVIYKALASGEQGYVGFGESYRTYALTGSHGTVMLNTGSINITLYGSYIKEGVEYHP